MISQHKDFLEAYWSLGLAESALGHHDAALRAFRIADDLAPDLPHTLAWRGFVEGRAGNHGAAKRCLARLHEIKTTAPVRSIHYSWILSEIGEVESALDYFERAIAEADPFTLYANVFFVYDSLRNSPRFRRVCEGLNLR
jgi:tetratricopeptide (TPR) repeat protein